jgi:hypothetical protein
MIQERRRKERGRWRRLRVVAPGLGVRNNQLRTVHPVRFDT